MKFVVGFNLKNEEISWEYRRNMLSIIKQCLENTDNGKYYNQYYEPGKAKDFCISVAFAKPIFSKENIKVEEKKLRLIVSTANAKTGFILFSAFMNMHGKVFPLPLGNNMKLISVKPIKEEVVNSEKILVRMMEPLCVRIHNRDTNKDWYVSVKQDIFQEECSRVVKDQLLLAGFGEDVCDVRITPIDAKTIVVKHYGINIESSIGNFMLEGNQDVLNYLLKSGLGSRRSTGFGVMKLLAEE